MTRIPLFQIDAFTGKLFRGNPAAVCPLQAWPDDELLQAIAQENNLAETAFFVPQEEGFHLRWFTPRHEVELCGHATLATAFVIFSELEPDRQAVHFETRSGRLTVRRREKRLAMDFPALEMAPCPEAPAALLEGLGQKPAALYRVESDPNYFAIYEDEEAVHTVEPDLRLLEQLHPYGVAVSAPAGEADCVSRYFAPSYGIAEDPVTGSIHCALVPYWAERLEQSRIHARQASPRGGELFCVDRGKRVEIAGSAVKYLEGTIWV